MKSNQLLATGALLLMSLFFFDCSEQDVCQNINPLLNEADYNTASYRKAVADAINKLPAASIHYYLDKYFVENDVEYITADIKSEDKLCAKVQLRIRPNVFLSDIRKTKGMGYRGAELEGIRFESNKASDNACIVVSSIESIKD